MYTTTKEMTREEIKIELFVSMFEGNEFQKTLIRKVLVELNKADPGLVTQENFDVICKNPKYVREIGKVFGRLHKINPKLAIQKNFDIICNNVNNAHAWKTFWVLGKLNKVNPKLATQENFDVIYNNKDKYVWEIAEGLVSFYKNQSGLVIQKEESFKAIQEHIKCGSGRIYMPLCQLDRVDLMTRENFNMVCRKAEYAPEIANVLGTLYKAKPGLVTQENFNVICEKAECAPEIANVLGTLYKAKPGLVTQGNFDKICKNVEVEYVRGIANVLRRLYKAKPGLVTQENFNVICEKAECAPEIANVLEELNKADPGLVTQGNFDKICKNAKSKYAQKFMAGVLGRLNKANSRVVVVVVTQETFDKICKQAAAWEAGKIAPPLKERSGKNGSFFQDENKVINNGIHKETLEEKGNNKEKEDTCGLGLKG